VTQGWDRLTAPRPLPLIACLFAGRRAGAGPKSDPKPWRRRRLTLAGADPACSATSCRKIEAAGYAGADVAAPDVSR